MKIEENLRKKLEKRKAANSYRKLTQHEELIDFVSNDYLGIAQNVTIRESLGKSLSNHELSIGSSGSRLLSGNDNLYEDTENKIANFHNVSQALLFNSGYHANTGLLSCIPTKDDTILYDQYIHASLRQGVQLSHAKALGFKHNDLESLEDKFRFSQGNVVIVVESIYSMDGDSAPLQELVNFCQDKGCDLIVDEAHATGIIGQKGEGMVQHKGLEKDVFARIHTFGKALGIQGAVILGSSTLKEYLVNFAKPFIYTTALPPMIVFAIYKIYELFPEMKEEREKVLELSQKLESKLKNINQKVIAGAGPIKSLIVPGNEQVKKLADHLQDSGFDLRPILAPTIPKGQERLRICLHAFNSEEQINSLAQTIDQFFRNENR